MDYLAKWNEACARNKLLHFIDIILKGYGQVLICLNPLTGLLLAAAIFYLSRAIWLLTLLSVISSTLTAFIIRARSLHLRAGVYGFNGVVLGIAWLWFLKLNISTVILLIFAASFSSLLMKLLIETSSRTRTNLPVFSVPGVIMIWLIIILLRSSFARHGLSGPDRQIIEYLEIFKSNFASLGNHFTLRMFLKTFHRQLVVLLILLLGVRVHSPTSAKVFLASFPITMVMVYLLGGGAEFANIEFYMYNTIPCSLALGGIFLVFNRRVFLFAALGVTLSAWLTFMGLRYFWLPVFVAPFNLVTILFIWFVKSNLLKREQGFYAIPMDLISTPEFGIEWYKAELYADGYWRRIQNDRPGKI